MALALRQSQHPTVPIQEEISVDAAWGALNQVSGYQKVGIIEQIVQRGEAECAICLDAIVPCLSGGYTLPEVKEAVCQAVRVAGPAGLAYSQEITQLLGDQNPGVQYQACMTLAALGTSLLTVELSRRVVDLLGNKEEVVRYGACMALGGLEAEDAAGRLAEALGDSSPEVQGAACWALGKLGEKGSQSAATVAKKLGEPRCRAQAVTALSLMGSAGATYCEDVCGCLADPDADVRVAAAVAVGKMGRAVRGSAAWDTVTETLSHPDGQSRAAAALALGYMGTEGADQCDALLALLEDEFEESAANALTVGGCRPGLPASFRKTKCAAAAALGMIAASNAASVNTRKVAEEVARLLHEDSWESRAAACDSLALMGSQASDQAMKLSTLFDDHQYLVRACAARACGKLGDASSSSALVDLLSDKAPTVREAALLALADLDADDVSEFIGKVVEMLTDASPAVRAAACMALSQMGDKGKLYASAVAQHLDFEEASVVRVAALRALQTMGSRGKVFVQDLSEYLEDHDPQVRLAASKLLGHGPGMIGAGPAMLDLGASEYE